MCRHGIGKDATVDLQWRKYIYILMKVRYIFVVAEPMSWSLHFKHFMVTIMI